MSDQSDANDDFDAIEKWTTGRVPNFREYSYLCWVFLQQTCKLMVARSGGGFYIGVRDEETGEPMSRDSEYFPTKQAAAVSLLAGRWDQRYHP